MPKYLALLAAFAATPAFAHDGPHMHPHADDPVWVPILLCLGVALAVIHLLRSRK